MKNILIILLSVGAFAFAKATPVSPTVTTTASPKVGQAPEVNHFAAADSPYYRMSWRTVIVGSATVNYLASFSYTKTQWFTADNVYAATTYAEIQAKCTALGIANLPADPNAGH
jgi:hypothetical protein